jgi:hypothetical protein
MLSSVAPIPNSALGEKRAAKVLATIALLAVSGCSAPAAGNAARRAFGAAFLARAEAAVADLEAGAALRAAGIG